MTRELIWIAHSSHLHGDVSTDMQMLKKTFSPNSVSLQARFGAASGAGSGLVPVRAPGFSGKFRKFQVVPGGWGSSGSSRWQVPGSSGRSPKVLVHYFQHHPSPKKLSRAPKVFFTFWGPFMRHVCLGGINEARLLFPNAM